MPENPVGDKLEGDVYITHVSNHGDYRVAVVRGVKEDVFLLRDREYDHAVKLGHAKVKIARDLGGDLVMQKYEPIAEPRATPGTQPTYTPQRAATVKLTSAIHEYLDVKYQGGRRPVMRDKEVDAYLSLWLAIHGDEGTPGMAFAEAETPPEKYELEATREIFKLLGRAISLSAVAATCGIGRVAKAILSMDEAWTELADKVIEFAEED